jgi:hypothetical protein
MHFYFLVSNERLKKIIQNYQVLQKEQQRQYLVLGRLSTELNLRKNSLIMTMLSTKLNEE